MNKIRLGIIGGGGDSLIGVLHRVASSMFDKYEINKVNHMLDGMYAYIVYDKRKNSLITFKMLYPKK